MNTPITNIVLALKNCSSLVYITSILVYITSITTIFINTFQSSVIFHIRNCRRSHRRCSVEKVFLEFSQNSQENTCARVTFLLKLQVPVTSKDTVTNLLTNFKLRFHFYTPENVIKLRFSYGTLA